MIPVRDEGEEEERNPPCQGEGEGGGEEFDGVACAYVGNFYPSHTRVVERRASYHV